MDFSKAKLSRGEKFKRFLKTYAYYIVLGIAVLAIVITAIVGAAIKANNTGGNIIEPPVDEVPVEAPKVVWGAPVAIIEILKGYDADALQLNETFGKWQIHKAIDFKMNEGDNVFCVLDGTVKSITTNLLTGTVVEIEHDGGFISSYGSLNSNVNVKVGDKLKTGAVIGTAAATAGNEASMGAHLHFELTKDNVKVNPALYIDLGDK